MSPIIGEQDDFEGLYTEKFRALARPYGEFVKESSRNKCYNLCLCCVVLVQRLFTTLPGGRARRA